MLNTVAQQNRVLSAFKFVEPSPLSIACCKLTMPGWLTTQARATFTCIYLKQKPMNSETKSICLCLQNQKVKCSENEVVYDLLATVGHVQDLKSGGNLVAHIHVGTTYHSRKEVCV